MTKPITGAEAFVQCLSDGGIDTVFALPGEETSDLMAALQASEIEIVLCRHEQAAAFMASVHGRLTGRPAACLATLGPGATNLVTGVADATLDHVPLIAITGQGARSRLHRGAASHQIIDLERLFQPVAKQSVLIREASQIGDLVAEALRTAIGGTPGAVHVSLPEDLAGATLDTAPSSIGKPQIAAPFPNPKALSDAVNQLNAATRPLVLAGAGVGRAGADGAFADFIDRTGLPVATSFMAKGLLPPDHALHLGAFGLPVNDHVDRAIAASDLLIAVGLDPVEYPVSKLSQGGEIPTLRIDTTEGQRDLGWRVTSEVIGDFEATLDGLGRAASRKADLWADARAARAGLLSDLNHALGKLDDTPPSDTALVAALNNTLGDGDLILSGVGTHKLSLARNLMPGEPGQVIIANGLAGMGLALPGTIAAARLGRYDRVLAVCGDGDVMMNIQDMETATRLDLAMSVVVWIDGGYGLIEDKQEGETGQRPDLGFSQIDWAQLAGAFGWHHTSCNTARDLRDCLAVRTAPERRHLITVPVRYDGSLA
ncbi:thiamine pyrophosphate-binding protein [Gymnodinialimonas ulvae]|uniref:thiamine pyrophosphate-binding protein n=1 Tax=Gymnodinialimonas ulvae TaxID=3126504 RepID=UPI0030A7B615